MRRERQRLASRMMGHNADYGIILFSTGLAIRPACVGSLLFRLTVKGTAVTPYTGKKYPIRYTT